MDRPLPDISSLRPAGGKRSSKRDRILEIFLRQEGHLSADDLCELVRHEENAGFAASCNDGPSAPLSWAGPATRG